MNRNSILVFAAVVAVALLGRPAYADGPGTLAVKKANETLAALLAKKAKAGSKEEKQQAAEVTTSLRDFLDVEELGKRALSDHWDKLAAEKRTEFMTLLRGLIEKNYIKGLRANLDYKIAYKGERVHGKVLIVSTEIEATRRGRPVTIAIDYTLRQEGKRWVAFDIITDGVGLVDNYRAQFNKIIAKDGFDGLIARMKKKSDKLD